MAAPLLLTLGKAAAKAWTTVYSGVAKGQSAAATLRVFRAGGGQITTQTFYDLFRAQKAAWAKGANIRFLNRDSRMSPESLPFSFKRLRKNFSYLVEVRGRAPRKEGQPSYFVTVTSFDNLTPNQIYASITKMLRSRYADSLGSQESLQLVFAERSV